MRCVLLPLLWGWTLADEANSREAIESSVVTTKNPMPHSRTVRPRKPPRITYLKVENFRALRKVELKDLTPLTVLLGPNGSGKSTVFDVFAFLSECFETGLRRAWDRRGRAKELKTRGSNGPLVVEIKYSEPGRPLITYHLAIDERNGAPIVVEEWLRWKRGSWGQPFRFLDYKEGRGKAVSGEAPDEQDARVDIALQSPDLIAVNALGQFADHPRVAVQRRQPTHSPSTGPDSAATKIGVEKVMASTWSSRR